MVSVIVPAYNVEKYIEQCLKSVINQTYHNLEIIVIDDASIDGTFSVCQSLSKIDSRITLYKNQKTIGVGASRNRGLSCAKGDYVFYLDSDDWIAEEYIEKLVNTIESTNATYVSGNGYWSVDERGDKKLESYLSGYYSGRHMLNVLLMVTQPAIWGKLFRRNWIIEKNLMQPESNYGEDWAYEVELFYHVKSVIVIDFPGVFYRNGRPGCLTLQESISRLQNIDKSMNYIIDRLHKYRADKLFYDNLFHYCIKEIFLHERLCKNEREIAIVNEIKHKIEKIFGTRIIESQLLVFGGFSSRWIAMRAALGCKINHHFAFSSLVSAMCIGEETNIAHNSTFRKEQIIADITGELCGRIKNIKEDTIIFIDLLEERYDLLMSEKGNIFTNSEAYLESEHGNEKSVKICREEHLKMWYEACDRLSIELKDKNIKVILSENYLSSLYGDLSMINQRTEKEDIDRINADLEKMYEYAQKVLNPIIVIKPDERYEFTFGNFAFGNNKEYYNKVCYQDMANRIFTSMYELV